MADITIGDVAAATEQLLRRYGATQNQWVSSRQPTTGQLERMAIYVALKVLLKTFPVECATSDPAALDDLAEQISLCTAASGEPPIKAQA